MATKYLKGSWRGAEFVTKVADDKIGRETVVHELPGRIAYTEDMGPLTDRFTIDAIVIGVGFEAARDKLEVACRQSGPGKLVHPYRGELTCSLVGPVGMRQSTKEGGSCSFTLTFILATEQAAARVSIDTAFAVKTAGLLTLSRMKAPTLSVVGPDFLTRAAAAILAGPRGLTNALSKINNGIQSKLNLVNQVSASIAEFSGQVNTLLRSLSVLALALQNLINTCVTSLGITHTTVKNSTSVGLAVSAITNLGTLGDSFPAVVGTTTARNQQRANQSALVDVIETAALVHGVIALTGLPLDNTDQANGLLDDVGAIFDRIMERGTLDDDAFNALRDTRAAYYAHLLATTKDLTGLGRYTPPVTTQALVLAYQLFGDASFDLELVERNNIPHPCFVTGGVELAVPNA